MLDLLLRDVRLPDGRVLDISILEGRIAHCGAAQGHADVTIECGGMLCLPGAIDMHVHMRGGVQSGKEDWESGTRSAIAGGVTLVVDQPNTIPPITRVERFRERLSEARRRAYCHFAINAGVDRATEFEGLWRAGAMAFGEIFLAPSSYGASLSDDELFRSFEKIGQLGALATIHAESALCEDAMTLEEHDSYRPEEGEAEAVRSIAPIAAQGVPVHFCHLSSAVSIDAAEGSVEVTPHHLLLSWELFSRNDARAKVNPPLRKKRVQEMLWSRWDRIDVIASDHAPHTLAEKRAPFNSAPAGIPGVETMIPLLLACVRDGRISIDSIVRKTVLNPARILGIEPPGLEKGNRADLALYRMEPQRIDPEGLHSRAGWTPFEGMDAIFPEIVVLEGECVFRDGDFTRREPRWFPGRGYIDRK